MEIIDIAPKYENEERQKTIQQVYFDLQDILWHNNRDIHKESINRYDK